MAKAGQKFFRRIQRMHFSQAAQRVISLCMDQPGQTSFRRILLSRILILSVPLLLAGQYITYRKAASGVQETARQNLPESAARKAERLHETIQFLEVNLLTASQTSAIESGNPKLAQQFITQLAKQLPTQSQCIQLTNIKTQKIVASTCDKKIIISLPNKLWSQQQQPLNLNSSMVHVVAIMPGESGLEVPQPEANNQERPLQLIFSAPVYNQEKQLSYVLSIQSALYQQERDQPGSLSGSTVVINEKGVILQHPIANRVGRKIDQEPDKERLQTLVKNAIAGQQNFIHLAFAFADQTVAEAVAGYAAIPSPLTSEPNQKWIVVAVTRRENALADLRGIISVVLAFTLCLILGSLVASIFLSRDLARPIEKLRDYALNVQGFHSSQKIPKDFQIREFNQLALALKNMVDRLQAWAKELETAWKEAQAANQLKSEFLANTSHELRTPLNAIIGCVRLVKDGCCDDEEEEIEFLQRADDAAIHLLNIINDILDLSKVEAGTLCVVMEPIDVRSLLHEVVDLQKVQLQQKGLQLHWLVPQDPLIVQADPAKLKQVFLNVVGNAIKFTEQGSITITTKVETVPNKESSSDDAEVAIAIEDTGIGIEPEQQQKLFRPFVMADGTRTRKYGGTGLGLAISRKLIQLMGGSITLHSAGIGKGTTVEIVLPTFKKSEI